VRDELLAGGPKSYVAGPRFAALEALRGRLAAALASR
jgi:hypothetical protein